jgi:hypothetical protein
MKFMIDGEEVACGDAFGPCAVGNASGGDAGGRGRGPEDGSASGIVA